ncbi:hypothetical protein ACMD2_09192 [Ananas comosus]|uniref:Uncharacterized protein n=1 Tax=Ananas comosus TaxID=4615 RepID=A0A199W9N7_ANACO|nr:hypothetical protein ACMD2_09192 [Ananas comosus]
MKREGWQHGMVRFNPKSVKHLESEPAAAAAAAAAGFRSRLLPKPTNNSKFTGKCRKARCKSCHCHPVSKSRDKAKGAYKLKSCDVALNHRLVSWRLVDEGRPARQYFRGISATALLGSLSSNSWHEEEEEEEEEFAAGSSYEHEGGFYGQEYGSEENAVLEFVDKIVESSDDKEQEEEEEEEDDMGFFMVGIGWEFSDGEDWLVVEEI